MEQLPEVLPTVDPELGALVHAELAGHGVEVLTGTTVQAISKARPGQAGRLHVQATTADGSAVTRAADMVLVVVGVRPETSLAADAGATLGAQGRDRGRPGMRTGLPDVFAAGDCVITHHRLLGVTYLPLGTTAHKQGRVAGENALGGNRQFAGSLGTQVVKIFDQAAARTGLRDHEAQAAGFDPVTVASQADDHKAYYPGSHRITMRVTGDRATGRLLGLQLFGHRHAEIAKRIDIAATAIFHNMTVDAISDLDLSYTPPLGSPWERGPDGRPGLGPGHPAALSPPPIFKQRNNHVRAQRRARPAVHATPCTQPSGPPPPRSSCSPSAHAPARPPRAPRADPGQRHGPAAARAPSPGRARRTSPRSSPWPSPDTISSTLRSP